MRRSLAAAVLAWAALLHAAAPDARADDAWTILRVFLRDGRAIASYGEYALVGDRVVFTVPIGEIGGRQELQLMSLPVDTVDLERTAKYAEAARAARYAATRGEADYAAMTVEVARALDTLLTIPDKRERLAVAEEARRRLLAWSESTYRYRADDIRELAALFDEVIAELRAAAGETAFSVEFVSGGAAPAWEPLRPAPGLRESIELALTAATATDVGAERTALLRAALAVLVRAPAADDLRAAVVRRLDEELAADRAYATLRVDLLSRAEAAMRRGDVRDVDALRRELAARDERLGGRRPADVREIARALDDLLDRTRRHRLALDHHAMVRRTLLQYERRVRPILAAFDGLQGVLDDIRDMSGPEFHRLERALARLTRLETDLAAITPPEDLAAVHATFASALALARQAAVRRRHAIVTRSLTAAEEGSSAAAGAGLLVAQARHELVRQLFPPEIR